MYPGTLREETDAVLEAMAHLGCRCCGEFPNDRTGTNQYYVRVKCRVCGQLCMRYRRG